MNIKILNEAELDIANGIEFYEVQKEGLGRYFYNSILSDINSLQLYAGIHYRVKNFYRALSKNFPFAIYYKYNSNTIYIYAILDCRQNPTWINTRLTKTKADK